MPLALMLFIAASSIAAHDAGARVCVVRHWNEARYRGYGYDHVVHLHNGCERRLVCSVTTSANPKPVTARLEAGRHVALRTFQGSPSRAFSARVECRVAGLP